MGELKGRRMFFVGIGSSFHAAQIARWLWRRHVSPQAFAVHSFDFVRLPEPVGPGDVVVLLSHRGNKSFSVEAAGMAHHLGAVTVGITGQGSSWRENLVHRLEASEMEDTGAFTKSLTCTLAWIARWIDDSRLIEGLREACARFEQGPPFPRVREGQDVILVGDMVREWVAWEISLKLQEAAYLPARAFGLEEFLHGPRISAGEKSLVIGFTDALEPRWQALRDYLRTVEVCFLEVATDHWHPGAAWLGQLFWGQRLTLEVCHQLGIDPDSLRSQDPRYRQAREKLSL
jgi:fructoselysine-6-P-deglycase FrlB-like protein